MIKLRSDQIRRESVQNVLPTGVLHNTLTMSHFFCMGVKLGMSLKGITINCRWEYLDV